MRLELVHSLIQGALTLPSCVGTGDVCKTVWRKAFQGLYYAACMDCVQTSPYGPHLTQEQKSLRTKLGEWGVFLCLYYLFGITRSHDLKELFDKPLPLPTSKDIRSMIATIRAYQLLSSLPPPPGHHQSAPNPDPDPVPKPTSNTEHKQNTDPTSNTEPNPDRKQGTINGGEAVAGTSAGMLQEGVLTADKTGRQKSRKMNGKRVQLPAYRSL